MRAVFDWIQACQSNAPLDDIGDRLVAKSRSDLSVGANSAEERALMNARDVKPAIECLGGFPQHWYLQTTTVLVVLAATDAHEVALGHTREIAVCQGSYF